MNSIIGRGYRFRGRRGRAGVVLACVALAGLVAACGSSSSSSSAGAAAGASSGSTAAPNVSPAALESVITQAFGEAVSPSSLPPLVDAAFKRAAVPLTAAQVKLAIKCYNENDCTLGPGKDTIAIADGNGGHSWRYWAHMLVILQAMTYPQVGHIIYTNANDELAQFQSNMRTLIAQKPTVIVTFDDFGAAAIPLYAQAQAAGIVVANYVSGVPGATAAQVTTQVGQNNCAAGVQMATAAAKATKDQGTYALVTGSPGNSLDAAWQKCAVSWLAAHAPAVKTFNGGSTSWDATGASTVGAALVSSGRKITAILYADAVSDVQLVEAFQKANVQVPIQVVWNQNNLLFQIWQSSKASGHPWQLFYSNATIWPVRVAVTAAMDKVAGQKVPAVVNGPLPFVPAASGLYQPSQSAGFESTTTLPPSIVGARWAGGVT